MKEESLDIPYPAGHNWEGLTPRQVNEGYAKRKKSLSEKIIELMTNNFQSTLDGKCVFIGLDYKMFLDRLIGLHSETVKGIWEEDIKESLDPGIDSDVFFKTKWQKWFGDKIT